MNVTWRTFCSSIRASRPSSSIVKRYLGSLAKLPAFRLWTANSPFELLTHIHPRLHEAHIDVLFPRWANLPFDLV